MVLPAGGSSSNRECVRSSSFQHPTWDQLTNPTMCAGTTPDVLYDLRPNMTIDIWDSIWQVTDGKPVAHVVDCPGGCTNQQLPWVPDTRCN